MKEWLLNLQRKQKRLIQLCIDLVLIWLSLIFSFIVRIGWHATYNNLYSYKWLFIITPILTIPVFIRFGLYRAVMRYIGVDFFLSIGKAVAISSLLLTLFLFLFGNILPLTPRSLIFNFFGSLLVLIITSRLFMRYYFLGGWLKIIGGPFKSKTNLPRVLIYGAGSAGNQLFIALKMGKAFEPVGFIDDDIHLIDGNIDGLKIYSPTQIEKAIQKTQATELLLAIPSAPRSRRQEILNSLTGLPVRVRTIPGFMDLAKGRVQVQDLQEIDIADLLGRDQVTAHHDLYEYCIKNQVVMVTGAGGSIGSEICRQVLQNQAQCLILFEQSEYNLYKISTELNNDIAQHNINIKLIPILGSVQDEKRLYDVMSTWKVDTIYHTAAYKHVPIVEANISQGIMNNIFGTLSTAQMAIKAKVKHFVLISTDKAVRPTNIMGSTKRLAEMVLQALSAESINMETRFTMVRFGNVLGSSGSVIPLFRKQIQEGSTVTVTHPEITRYFMTIPEAAELVIQAGSLGKGGDVFVLDMGKPVKIINLAEKMIQLAGLTIRDDNNPTGDIAIQFTGLRPGEKLYEELLIGDNVTDTEHPMIMRANETMIKWKDLEFILIQISDSIRKDDYENIRTILSKYIDGYIPQCEIIDSLYNPKITKNSI